MFIALAKFVNSPAKPYPITDPVSGTVYNIYGFSVTNTIPFPVETNTASPTADLPFLPYIAFNYLGQLVSEVDAAGNYRDAYIPLAKGSIILARDSATRALQFDSPSVMEMPPGNSTNSSYNIVHIDRLTGRAVLEFQKMR
jgi:hypothetical protein